MIAEPTATAAKGDPNVISSLLHVTRRLIGMGCVAFSLFISMPAQPGSGVPTQSSDPNALGIGANFGKWPGGFVPWVYNSTGAPNGYTDDAAVVGWIQDALNSWMGVCGVTFISAGIDDASVITNMDDNLVVFAWEDIGGAAGLAGPFFSTPAPTLTQLGFHPYIDGSLRLNPNVFALSGGESPAALANNLRGFLDTVLHEIGHLIGLGHSDEPLSRMYANPYNSVTSLRQDDIDACRSMYGYPNLSFPLARYAAPAPGANPFATLFLANSTVPLVPVNAITDLTDATLAVSWSVTGPFNQAVGAVAVDPGGFDSVNGGAQINCPMGFICSGWFSINSYDRMRETPGTWNVDVIINNQRVQSLPINVSDLLPAVNNVPTAEFSFSEDPGTRQIAASLNVTGDADGDTAIVTWHLPTLGPQAAQNIAAYPTNSARNVDIDDTEMHEVFVELSDNSARYAEDPPNNVGPAGAGFNRLYRYVSSGLNLGPDHDGDNSSDVMLRNGVSGRLFYWQMQGNSITAGGTVSVVGDLNWRVVSDRDFNGDGKSDVMWRHDLTGEVYYWAMNGRSIVGGARVARPSDLNWRVVGDGDYDGDGRADLLWRHAVDGRLHLWTMNGSTIVTSRLVTTVADLAWQIVGDDDSDGDGMADITWMHGGNGRVFFWSMNGATITGGGPVATVGDLQWAVVANADYDGDGLSDLLWRHGTTGEVYLWQMNGQTIVLGIEVAIVPDGDWLIAGSGDYNGDGSSDILWRNTTTNEVYQWQMLSFLVLRGGRVTVLSDANWQIIQM